MNGEVVDPTGVSDPAPYPGLIIEEMMESASEAGEARDSKSERVSYLPLHLSLALYPSNTIEIYFRVRVL